MGQFFVQDMRHAARSLLKSRRFTIIAVLTLALGIGANTVIFSVINAALLRPLPFPKSSSLMIAHWQDAHGRSESDVPARAVFQLQRKSKSLEIVAVTYASSAGVNLSTGQEKRYVKALRVSWNFFQTLAIGPKLGRDFEPAQDMPGGPNAVILSYDLWQQAFGGASSTVGTQLRINGETYTAVGIMPPGFRSYPEADLWLPLQLTAATSNPGSDYRLLARLKRGISKQQSQQELDLLSSQDPLPYAIGMSLGNGRPVLQGLQDFLVSDARKSLEVLVAAVFFLLMVAGTNVAVMMLVRVLARNHEIAIRAALGASRIRLVRIFLIESVMLSFFGGLFGLIFAKELLPLILAIVPSDLQLSSVVKIDLHVAIFTLALSVMMGLLAGLIPAFKTSSIELQEILKQTPGQMSPGQRQTRTANLMIASQAALTVVLLSAALLLIRTFVNLRSVPPGFNLEHTVVAQVSLSATQYRTSSTTSRYIARIIEQLRVLPGVESAASANSLPLEVGLNMPLYPDSSPDKIAHVVQYRIVSPEYFRAMGISISAGRPFANTDNETGTPVVIVSESLARRWWQGSALGHYVSISSELGPDYSDRPRLVIGVAQDVRDVGLGKPPSPTVFIPVPQSSNSVISYSNKAFFVSFIIRTNGSVDVSHEVRQTILSSDPDISVASLLPLTEVVDGSLSHPRFYATLTGIFAGFALVLTAVGLFGLMSYQVGLRAKEIGVRMAMGAQRSGIVVQYVKQGVALVTLGAVIGMVGALFLSRFLESMLYNLHGAVAGIAVIATLLLMLVAALASLLTAFRAASIEPVVVLRSA